MSESSPAWWVHDLSPWIFHVGSFGVRWYGLAYLLGLAWGLWMLHRWRLAGRAPFRKGEGQDFVLAAGMGMIIGGRLGYCLLYGLDHWKADWLYPLKLWQGGMASHGGMAGLALGCWWWARKHGRDLLVLVDLVAATAPMGILLGRCANFINGELWGRISTVRWAMIFPDAAPHPEELSGRAAWHWQQAQGYVNLPRHPSQLYEAFLEGALLLALILPLHARHRRPGLSAGILLAAYGVARIVAELFREPDLGRYLLWGCVTKGQAFSVPLILIGVGLAFWAWRRGERPGAYLPPAS